MNHVAFRYRRVEAVERIRAKFHTESAFDRPRANPINKGATIGRSQNPLPERHRLARDRGIGKRPSAASPTPPLLVGVPKDRPR